MMNYYPRTRTKTRLRPRAETLRDDEKSAEIHLAGFSACRKLNLRIVEGLQTVPSALPRGVENGTRESTRAPYERRTSLQEA